MVPFLELFGIIISEGSANQMFVRTTMSRDTGSKTTITDLFLFLAKVILGHIGLFAFTTSPRLRMA
jgi:hypothetical protein